MRLSVGVHSEVRNILSKGAWVSRDGGGGGIYFFHFGSVFVLIKSEWMGIQELSSFCLDSCQCLTNISN